MIKIHIKDLDYSPELNIAHIELGDLSELSDSIKRVGIYNPILVRKVGEKYQVVAGFRRTHAAMAAGLKEIPCEVLNYTNEWEYFVAAITENLHNKAMNPIEEARAYSFLRHEGFSIDQIADHVSQTPAHVASVIELMDFSDVIRDGLVNGDIKGVSHAHELSRLPLEYQPTFIKKFGCSPLKVLRKAVDKKLNELKGGIKNEPDEDKSVEEILNEEALQRSDLKERTILLTSIYRPGLTDDARAFNYKKLPDEFIPLFTKLFLDIPTCVEDMREFADKLERGEVEVIQEESELAFWGNKAPELWKQVQEKIKDADVLIAFIADMKNRAKKDMSKGGKVRVPDIMETAEQYGIDLDV